MIFNIRLYKSGLKIRELFIQEADEESVNNYVREQAAVIIPQRAWKVPFSNIPGFSGILQDWCENVP